MQTTVVRVEKKKKTCKNLSAPAIKALFRLLQIVATAADQSSTGAVPLDDGRPHAIGPLIFGEAGQTVTSRFISLHFLVAAAHGRRPFVSGETLLSSAASNSRPFLCRGLTPNLFQTEKQARNRFAPGFCLSSSEPKMPRFAVYAPIRVGQTSGTGDSP